MSKSEINYNEEFDENSDENLHSISIKLLNDIEEILESKQLDNQSKVSSLSNILSTSNIPFLNRKMEKEIFNILESLRKKKKLDEFMEILQKTKIKNSRMLFILKGAFLSELNILSEIKKEKSSLIMIKVILGYFIFRLKDKEQKKLEHFLSGKYKSDNEYINNLIKMLEKSKNIYTIYICGLALSIKNLKEEEKENLSKIFSDYFKDKILDDSEKDKNLIHERILSKFLKYIKSNLFFNEIIPGCELLLNRNSKNILFVYNILIQKGIECTDDFVSNILFSKFNSFFFPKDNTNDNLCFSCFDNIANNSNRIKILEILLNKTFPVDQKSFYRYTIYYIVSIFKIKNSKDTNILFSDKLISNTILYILSHFSDSYSENFAFFFDKIFSDFISALISNDVNEKEEEKSSENEQKKIGLNICSIIDNKSLSNYHSFIFVIGAICVYKFNYKFDKNISNNLLSFLKDQNTEISDKLNNNLLTVTAFTLCYNNFDENLKKKSENYINTIFKSISSSKLFQEQYNELKEIDIICLYLIFKILIDDKESLMNNDKEIDIKMSNKFIKILSYLSFKKIYTTADLIVFKDLINSFIENEILSEKFLDFIFILILTLDSNKIPYISFKRVSLFLEKYSEKYFNEEMDDKTFHKFLILIHIPNMYLDSNINNKKSHNKNMFLDKFYKDEKTKEKLISRIENNIESICEFIFSDLGLFSKKNLAMVNSCNMLIQKIFKETKVSNILIKNLFGKFEFSKFQFIDNMVEYYDKNIDLIKKYELVDLVKTLKENEQNYKNTYNIIIPVEELKIEEEKVILNPKKNQGKKNKNQNQKKDNQNKNKKNQNVKKENKDEPQKVNVEEYKTYLISYCYKIAYNLIFTINRLKVIIELLNDITLYNSKENIKFAFEILWNLLKVNFCKDLLKTLFKNYFKKNPLTKKFAIEFSNLMYLESNKKNEIFNENYEENSSLISKFNSKFIDLFKDYENNEQTKEEVEKTFNYFDFIIIRILFYIVLNTNLDIEDTTESVENLISILKNLHSLNYNDISYLLMSLLKSNYTGSNMAFLLELFFKNASEENFLILSNYLLEYEYISKYSFLKGIIDINMNSISKYQSLQNKLFIICFEENETLQELAIKIWNKYNMIVTDDFINSDDFKLSMINHKEKDTVNKAIRALVHLIPSLTEKILDKFEKFYEKEIEEVNVLRNKNKEKENENENEEEEEEENEESEINDDNYPKLRIILLEFIDESIELFSSNKKKDILDFLIKVSDKEFDDSIFENINNTIFNLINSIPEKEIIENILSSIENSLTSIQEKNIDDINFSNLKIILMMLNSLLVRILHEEQFNEKKSILFDTLLSMARKMENREILYLLFRNFEYISSDISEKTKKIFEELITKIKDLKENIVNLGDLYCLSGLIKCFGISLYKEKEINDIILKNIDSKSSINEKINGIYMINILFETLKKLYEPYFVENFTQICDLITNKDNKVRETAQECFKGMMKELSGYGVNQIMPNLIKDLHEMNWKGKVANIEILGQFAFCAPKQLTIYIPKVIKEIMQVLKDPHEKVQETAIQVLNDIASAIKNPEIVNISSILIDAISNPFDNSKNALSALLETQFNHYLDPPSLALIIPIIDYNLRGLNNELKRNASHIIGSIYLLVSNNKDLLQYSDIIVPDLKSALFDGNPKCRNEIAKAIGALTKCLGPNYLEDMLKWIVSFLEKETDTVQRSGAAQAYAEILISFGDNYIDKHLIRLINKIQEGDHIVKEGYLSIFVFLPGCLGDKFEKYFELIFPLIIESFSDEHENVRNVSNKIFEICIKLFAKKNTNDLIQPLFIRLFDQNWRIRNSSIALIKTLINNLNNEFSKESSDYFPKEKRDQILTYTFILKSDQSGNTSTIANMIWRDYVDNIPKYLSKILKNIYEELMRLLIDQDEETSDIATQNVKLLASKFSDKFFMELLPLIKKTILEQKDNETIVSPSFIILLCAVSEISEKLTNTYKDKILKIINENLFTEFTLVRRNIAKIVYTISSKVNDRNMSRNLVFNVMKQARGKSTEEQKKILEIVAYLVEISEGDIINNAIGEIFRKPYEEGFLDLGTMISKQISLYYNDKAELTGLYNNLYETFFKFPIHSIQTIVSITEKIDEDSLYLFLDFLEKIQKKLEGRSGNEIDENKPKNEQYEYYLSELIYKFCEESQQDLLGIIGQLVNKCTDLLYFDNDEVTKNVGIIIKNLVEKTDKTPSVDEIIKSILNGLENLRKKYNLNHTEEQTEEILTNKFKNMMENILFTIQNGLLFGDEKGLSCELIFQVINHSSRQNLKPYIMKIVGPIIRILGEKIYPEIKEKLMDITKLLITKSKDDIKGISPQLQSVFIKTLTETTQNQNRERYQIKAGENIIRLLQYYPRADVAANDLLKSIQNKINLRFGLSALFEMDILSDLIRFYGQNLKENTITQQFNTVKMWLPSHSELPYDAIIVLLTSYTQFLKEDRKSEIDFQSNTSEKLYNFIEIFNGDLNKLNLHKKNLVGMISELKKDEALILLKPLGKIINKYRCYKEFNEKVYNEILLQYEKVIEDIFMNIDFLLSVSKEMSDGTLCLLLLSLGYMSVYDTNKKLLEKVLKFIINLINLSKINIQLLIGCLSLIVLKQIQQTPDKDDIMEKLEEITSDEKDIESIDNFLKKVYYLYDK